MRVVFVDFDGVLNSFDFLERSPGPFDRLDPAAAARLNTLVQKSGAKAVVSSTWRLSRTLPELRRILTGAGFHGEVIGTTPVLRAGIAKVADPCELRCMEIKAWLDATKEPVDRYVVLDDTPLEDVRPYLVQTNFALGLRDTHVEEALALLMLE